MHDQLVLALRVDDLDFVVAIDQPALVADLSAAFGIERCAIQDDLELITALAAHLAVAQDVRRRAQLIIADEGGLAFGKFDPIAGSGSSCSA